MTLQSGRPAMPGWLPKPEQPSNTATTTPWGRRFTTWETAEESNRRGVNPSNVSKALFTRLGGETPEGDEPAAATEVVASTDPIARLDSNSLKFQIWWSGRLPAQAASK